MKKGSGILLHISSLPSPYGIGDFGSNAYKFVDFLSKSKQRYWQILPLTPTKIQYGNSPYSSPSAFAGNSLFISPELLYKNGFVKKTDISTHPKFSKEKVDYKKVTAFKKKVLTKAYFHFKSNRRPSKAFTRFCDQHSNWLDDFALFCTLKQKYKNKNWNQWPKHARDRDKSYIKGVQADYFEQIEKVKFIQFLFYQQWFALKRYCCKKDIEIIGDIPIYVNFDSVEVWKNPHLFKLYKNLNPKFVAGVPPDYFSETGQRWGNPVYNWNALKKEKYSWWIKRIGHKLKLYDYLRIDHFRGLVAYWQVPSKQKTAMHGRWIRVPGHEFFKTVKKKYPKARIIAEDVGYITSPVRKLIKDTGFPGMKVLQFAFGNRKYNNEYLPHLYPKNCVAYTGTHDNNTLKGWYVHELTGEQKSMVLEYLGGNVYEKEVHWYLIKLLYQSKAKVVIIPIQDILGLGEEAKMNVPATSVGNWQWRLPKVDIDSKTVSTVQNLVTMTKRK